MLAARRPELPTGWIAALYALAFVPYVGVPVLVIGSSAFYFAWRRSAPEKAATLNRHAWIAWALAAATTLAWRFLR